ncbi:MAG TPA: hypothetical protein VIR01_10745 [Pyrinomonadaceae bacterium]
MTTKNNMNAADNYTSETNQKDLAAGVLKQAAQDLRRFHGATSKIEQELYFDAYSWVTSDDCYWPFSFLNVCQLLHLAPDAMRGELLGDAALSSLGYWTRRCGRIARRFQTFLSNPFTSEHSENAAEPATLTHSLN